MNRIAPVLLFSFLCGLLIQFPGVLSAEESVSQPAAPVQAQVTPPQASPESEVVRLYRQHRQEFADQRRHLEQQQSHAANNIQA
ncbi:MAG: hypothetical protein FWF31_09595, partial [Desulfobulbus sp.]|nr:hypothetical protein [Desulfobulbus sp.]